MANVYFSNLEEARSAEDNLKKSMKRSNCSQANEGGWGTTCPEPESQDLFHQDG